MIATLYAHDKPNVRADECTRIVGARGGTVRRALNELADKAPRDINGGGLHYTVRIKPDVD